MESIDTFQSVKMRAAGPETSPTSGEASKKILLIEDSPGDARLLSEMLNEPGSMRTELIHVEGMREAETYLAGNAVHVVLLDLGLPDAQGLEAVRRAYAAAPHTPLLVLTGLDDEALALQALQLGAQDYLIKNQIETRGLLRAIRHAVERNIVEEDRKRLVRLKDEFIATVSHELRTPLTSICGSIGLLSANVAGVLPDPAPRLIAIAYTNCQRLIRLIEDVLDIGKMEAGQIVFRFGCVEVRSLVEEVIEANGGFAAGYRVRLRLAEDCPAAQVRADRARLAQVVTNLLSNAIKFSLADHEAVVGIEKGHGLVRISIRNRGPGISEEFKPHIFERFARADSTNTAQKGGTGLGLSIVKQIVGRLGGEVGFSDSSGETTFYVELPSWDHLVDIAIDRKAGPDALRILLCEDDPDLAIVLREQLWQVGFATDFAYASSDAIASAKATQYCAVLVDLLLPDGDGISLIQRLRGLPRYGETPIIVMSADPSAGRKDIRSPELNVFQWLSKPVDFNRLTRALNDSTVR